MINIENQKYVTPEGTKPTRLVASAILKDGRIWVGERHGNLIPLAYDVVGERIMQEDQGFYTDDCRFVTRKQGEAIAKKNGQLPLTHKGTLLSEHLW